MRAIILAAGRATRLLPLTKDTPQCLLEVGGKAILQKQIEGLNEAGFEEITVITGYLSDKTENFCKSLNIKTLFNPFYDVSGVALTLWVAKQELKNGFIFLYSDVLFDSKIIKGLLETKEDICLAIKKDGLREEAEKVIEDGGIIKIVTKDLLNKENGEFIGIARFSDIGAEKLIKEIDSVAKINLNASFIKIINALIEKGSIVAAYDVKGAQFIDIDFPEDIEKAQELFI